MKWVASAILSPCSSMDFTKSIHWRGEGPQGFTTFRIQGLATATRATRLQNSHRCWKTLNPGKMIYTIFFHIDVCVQEGISKQFKTYIYIYIYLCVIWVWLTAHNSCRLHTVDSCGLCCPIGHGCSRRNNDSGKANVLTSTTIITWNQWNRHGPNTTMMAKIILASIFAQVKDTQKSTSVLIPYTSIPSVSSINGSG